MRTESSSDQLLSVEGAMQTIFQRQLARKAELHLCWHPCKPSVLILKLESGISSNLWTSCARSAVRL